MAMINFGPDNKNPLGLRTQNAAPAAARAPAPAPVKPAGPAMPQLGNYQGAANKQGQLGAAYKVTDPGAVKSPWLAQMMQQADAQKTQQLNQGAAQSAAGAAQAQASLARKGGLSGGSAERIAQGSADQSAVNAQNIRGAADQASNQMQTADMQNERQYQTGLQQANVATALQDLGQRQQFDMGKYGEQMKAYGAEKTAQATEKACFIPGTKIQMRDGTEKNIEDIIPGDDIFLGGKVRTTIKAIFAKGDTVYNHCGVFVTGEHFVKVDGKWQQVKESLLSEATTQKPRVVYNLVTEFARIVVNKVEFWDWEDSIHFKPKFKDRIYGSFTNA